VCSWADDGKVYCFGNRTGTALEADASVPLPLYLPPGLRVVQLACGSFHTMALTENGVYSWGANANGIYQLSSMQHNIFIIAGLCVQVNSATTIFSIRVSPL
jgi:alpha-tubulin suppressor-like RCC1 family protein